MAKTHGTAIAGFMLPVTLVVLASAQDVFAAWTLTLRNETGQTLTFYDVNSTPPPARLPSGTVLDHETFNIDPAGFNPVFAWDDGISMTGTEPNGFYIGMDLSTDPGQIQYKRFHYKVTPGTPGTDPTLQPVEIDQFVATVAEGDIIIVVDSAWNATIGPADGACCFFPGAGPCMELPTGGCPDGVYATFFSGASCTPALCTSASQTCNAAAGCTVQTPDHSVKVTFPPGCLSGNTTISIEDADWPSKLELFADVMPRKTVASFGFSPGDLTFCNSAELCMTADVTALSAAERAALSFAHEEKVCIAGTPSKIGQECTSNAWCGSGGICSTRKVTITTSPSCSFTVDDGHTIAECCININHFSDYALVAPDSEEIPVVCFPCVLAVAPLLLAGGLIYFGRRHTARA
jgi:hypothetical protein